MNINRIAEIKLGPLDALKKREVDFLPIHFSSTEINERYASKIVQWVRNKLTGRFTICRTPKIDADSKLRPTTVIGFEDEKELTYFMLACPYTRRN